jgi:O-antigen ligase
VPRRSGLQLGDAYLRWHLLVLLGYAVAGKGFAYLGVGPLYVGDFTLALGLLVAVTTTAAFRIPRSPPVLLLLGLVIWSSMRAVPGLLEHGIDALRDSVIWAYGLFALLLAGIVASKPARLAWLLRQYGRFARTFVIVAPGVWLLVTLCGEALPRVPGTEVSILHAKPNDILVHLAGIGSYQLAGLAPSTIGSLLCLSAGFALTATRTRGGLLAFSLAIGLVAAVRPLRRRLWVAVAGSLIGVSLLLSTDLGISVSNRELSARQLFTNVQSIFAPVHSSNLDGPKAWRLEWWSEIVDYTVFGPYFWLGKGFGINLATADGFDLDRSRRLRSPHNGHLTVLARVGVPGFLLWILTQLAWVREMARQYRMSRRAGERDWSRLFLFLIAYWLAFLANATFDVYLEGPMGGVWFWTVFGVGIAAARIHERQPAILSSRAALPHVEESRYG